MTIPAKRQPARFRFDEFEIDLSNCELLKAGRPIKLERLPMELLILLAENDGKLVTREEILQRLWGDNVFVDTRQGINTAIRKIRLALGDSSDEPRLLQTLPGRGYRLLVAVHRDFEPNVSANGEPSIIPAAPAVSGSKPAPLEAEIRWPRRRDFWFAGLAISATLILASIWYLRPRQHHRAIEHRITSNSAEAAIDSALISPDEKYIVYSDPTGLYVRVIATGESRPWPLPVDFIARPSSWFPDSIHLLVTRREGPQQTPSLWEISLVGGSPRKLIDQASNGAVSPDGTRIAYRAAPLDVELWLAESDGSNPRKLASASKSSLAAFIWIHRIAWSPDSRRVAFVENQGTTLPNPAEDGFSIRTVEARGGEAKVVLSDARIQPVICWAADARIFYGYRQDPVSERIDVGVRAIRVDQRDGGPAGKPEFITDGVGKIGSLSVTADGKRFAVVRTTTQYQVLLAEFDSNARRLHLLRRITLDANGSLATAWTPDSKSVVFVSNRGDTWSLYRQGIDDRTAEVLVAGRSIFLPRLSADGKQIIYQSAMDASDTSAPIALMRVPVAGGTPQLILRDTGIFNDQCATAPANLCIYSKLRGLEQTFIAFDPMSGVTHEIFRATSDYCNWDLSPDGRTLSLFPTRRSIWFYSLSSAGGNRPVEVQIPDWRILGGDWTSDGRSILMPSATPEGVPVLLSIGRSGKATVLLEGAANTQFWAGIPSPNGRYAIVDVEVPEDNNVWMIENP